MSINEFTFCVEGCETSDHQEESKSPKKRVKIEDLDQMISVYISKVMKARKYSKNQFYKPR